MRTTTTIGIVLGLSLTVGLTVSAGTLVVANKSEASVSLVDTQSGEIRATLPTGKHPHEVDVSPNGARALIGNYGTRDEPGSTLTLIDVSKAEVLKTIDLGEYSRPHGIVWIDDQNAVVTVEANQAVIRVDVDSGEVMQEIPTDAEISHMIAVSKGHGLGFVTNMGPGSVTVIDLALGKALTTIQTGEGAEGVAVTPNGRHVWVTNRGENTITVINASSRATAAKIEAGEFPIRAEATADGRFVLVTNAKSDDLSVFDAKKMAEVKRVEFEAVSKGDKDRLFSDRFGSSSVPIGIEIVQPEMRAYIAHANADDISIVDLNTFTVAGTLSAGKEPDGMGYSPLIVRREE